MNEDVEDIEVREAFGGVVLTHARTGCCYLVAGRMSLEEGVQQLDALVGYAERGRQRRQISLQSDFI